MDYTGYLLRTAFLRAATIAAREFGTDAHPRDAGVHRRRCSPPARSPSRSSRKA